MTGQQIFPLTSQKILNFLTCVEPWKGIISSRFGVKVMPYGQGHGIWKICAYQF